MICDHLGRLCCLAALLFLLTGCFPSRSLIILLPDSEGNVGEIIIESSDKKISVSEPYMGVTTKAFGPRFMMENVKKADVELTFGQALQAEPDQRFRFVKKTFYCSTDSEELISASRDALAATIVVLRKHPPREIYIVGHADRYGSELYNKQLSHRRAQALQQILVEAGVESRLITISSLGESKPLVETADGVRKLKNRRIVLVMKYDKAQ